MSALSSQLVAGLVGGFIALAAACSSGNVDTCDTGFKECRGSGTLFCCSTECSDTGCAAAQTSGSVSGSSGAASSTSGQPSYTITDPQCKEETDFTKRKFCGGRCMDLSDDNLNCGTCGNVCGVDTNGIQKTCFAGRCK